MQKDFSYPLKIDEIGQGDQHYKLIASKEQLDFLTEVLQVPFVHSFEADLKLKFYKKKGQLDITGRVTSEIGQISVISLEPFDKIYDTDFKLTFDTVSTYEDIKEKDVDIMADIPDIVTNGEINLADIAIEQLALILDDYPRKEGEEFEEIIEDISPIRNNPFAVLESLKKK